MPITEPTILTIKLDLIQTLAIAASVYFIGIYIKRKISFLDRLNIPSAVVGGLLFASLNLIAHDRIINIQFETAAQSMFMVMFFTTIGMSASIPLLRKGGLQVVIFLMMSTLFCFVQNFVGIGISNLFNVNPLLGVIAGSVTLVGGPATGLAFAPLFEKAGVIGADTIAITAATFGIVCGGIIGGPVGTRLINKYRLRSTSVDAIEFETETHPEESILHVQIDREDSSLVTNMLVAAIAMGIGSVVSLYIQKTGITLPAYIGAMLVASLIRNMDDMKGWFKIQQETMEFIGSVALNIFLVVALMDLKLWQLVHLALPLTVILLAQVAIVVAFALTICFKLMGKDYDSAVMASGFIGFVLGTTANAVANMRTLVNKYGASPKAFFIVPMVGAFFIDFTNSLIITLFLNWFR